MARTRARQEVSAGGVVYRVDGGRVLFLLIRDSYANWGFPKGHLEEGEDALASGEGEVVEEGEVAVGETFDLRGGEVAPSDQPEPRHEPVSVLLAERCCRHP